MDLSDLKDLCYIPSAELFSGKASRRAVASLLLGILSVTMILFGFVVGIPAFFLGRAEERAIRQGRAPAAGGTYAKVGWISGAAGSAVSFVATTIAAAILLFLSAVR